MGAKRERWNAADVLYTPDEIAALLGLSMQTLRQMRHDGCGPVWFGRTSRQARYSLEQFLWFLMQVGYQVTDAMKAAEEAAVAGADPDGIRTEAQTGASKGLRAFRDMRATIRRKHFRSVR